MKLWERIQRGMEAGFDAALVAVHNLTEKAGESIEVTRLRREKARLETQITRLMARLGNAVYEKLSEQRRDDLAKELGVDEMIKELAEHDARMEEIDRRLGEELGKEKEKEGERSG
jgi:transposase